MRNARPYHLSGETLVSVAPKRHLNPQYVRKMKSSCAK
jgi:hypothetical protein